MADRHLVDVAVLLRHDGILGTADSRWSPGHPDVGDGIRRS
ncbi:hypothetical protein [Nocardia sp. CY41]|nr:hypothetical protein [Nocardia sp. CY41]